MARMNQQIDQQKPHDLQGGSDIFGKVTYVETLGVFPTKTSFRSKSFQLAKFDDTHG